MFPLQKTGNGLLYSFNPITGKPSDENALHGTVLPYQIKQATMLDLTDEDFLKVVLLMDTDHKVRYIQQCPINIKPNEEVLYDTVLSYQIKQFALPNHAYEDTTF